MSSHFNTAPSGKIEGSQLKTHRRILLLIKNPGDAFALLSDGEKLQDAGFKSVHNLYGGIFGPVPPVD